jgi:hypothetical protein
VPHRTTQTLPPWLAQPPVREHWYPGRPEPVLLADRARTARAPGRCARCPLPVRPGDRVADLADGTGVAHLGCIR